MAEGCIINNKDMERKFRLSENMNYLTKSHSSDSFKRQKIFGNSSPPVCDALSHSSFLEESRAGCSDRALITGGWGGAGHGQEGLYIT